MRNPDWLKTEGRTIDEQAEAICCRIDELESEVIYLNEFLKKLLMKNEMAKLAMESAPVCDHYFGPLSDGTKVNCIRCQTVPFCGHTWITTATLGLNRCTTCGDFSDGVNRP